MSDRGAALADEFRRAYASVDELLRSLSDTEWGLLCSAEGWPVGYVAHHIGHGIVRPRGWIEQLLVGEDPFDFDWETTHELNRRRSGRLGLPALDDTLRFVRVAADYFAALTESLSDAQLSRIGFTQKGHQRDVEWVVRLVMRHMDEHSRSIRAAIGRLPAAP